MEKSFLNNISDDDDDNNNINKNTNEDISNINNENNDNDNISNINNENNDDDNDDIYNITLRVLAVGFIFDYFHTIDIINLLISSKVLLNFRGMIKIYKATFKLRLITNFY